MYSNQHEHVYSIFDGVQKRFLLRKVWMFFCGWFDVVNASKFENAMFFDTWD